MKAGNRRTQQAPEIMKRGRTDQQKIADDNGLTFNLCEFEKLTCRLMVRNRKVFILSFERYDSPPREWYGELNLHHNAEAEAQFVMMEVYAPKNGDKEHDEKYQLEQISAVTLLGEKGVRLFDFHTTIKDGDLSGVFNAYGRGGRITHTLILPE